jgi:hypothetical protein
MNSIRNLYLALLAVAVVGLVLAFAVPVRAAEVRADVVRPADIQASIDQKVNGEAAEREAIRTLLRRPDVKKVAGAAGLNVTRMNDAVAQLSGADLANVAARADEINATAGGRQTVTVAVTTIIIVLLLIIILTR